MYDYIIVGAGIAGLYTAYRLVSHNRFVKLLLLEKRSQVGGRAGTELFYDVPVAIGAGIGRKKKDKRLLQLLNTMQIQVSYYKIKKQHVGFDDVNLVKVLKYLQKEWKKEYKLHPFDTSFKTFAQHKLGVDTYNRFILTSGYSDYEHENVWSALFHYGMDDNADSWKAFFVPWGVLESKLLHHIGAHRIETNKTVVNIEGSLQTGFEVTTSTLQVFYAKQVILASTIGTVQRLVAHKNLRFQPLLDKIQSQPFLRVYGKFSVTSAPIVQHHVPTFTIVTGPLQKIIPIQPDKGVYMICYNDNQHAQLLIDNVADTEDNRQYFCHLFRQALGIPEELELEGIKGYYWKEGTHYYRERPLPTERVQSDQGITIVGELISTNQGWVEGALESVDNIMDFIS